MAHKTANHVETGCLNIILHSRTDVINIVAGPGLLYSDVQAFFGNLHEFAGLVAHLANRKGTSSVAHKTFKHNAHVNAHNVALFKQPRRRETVNNLLVYRAAQGEGVTAVTKKRRFYLVVGAHVARHLFKTHGRQARLHHVAHGIQYVGNHAVCFPQAGHFPFILDECAVIFFHYTITIRACENHRVSLAAYPKFPRACRSYAPWP